MNERTNFEKEDPGSHGEESLVAAHIDQFLNDGDDIVANFTLFDLSDVVFLSELDFEMLTNPIKNLFAILAEQPFGIA